MYQFEVPDELWNRWKRQVPRDKNLDERIRELLVEDIDEPLAAVQFPRDRRECEAAVDAAIQHILELGGASKNDLVRDVMPAHPVGYDVPDLEEGERYRGGRYRSVIKPGLGAHPAVDAPKAGGSEWRMNFSEHVETEHFKTKFEEK